MMKELSLKELQNEELKILKDVHEFCVNNNIQYSLYGGTLIGALRHKGFIPWDDDIDIIMPRPDYTRFCQIYKSDRYRIADLDHSKGYMLAFARVYDNQKTTTVSKIPWLSADAGVWIDVFPADGMVDDKVVINETYKKAHVLLRKLIFVRKAYIKFSTFNSFLDKTKLLIRKIVTINGMLASIYVKKLDKLIKTYDFENSPLWASLSNIETISQQKHHSKKTFQTTLLVDFEDMKACMMNGADEMLRERNGDYMKLPPESERTPKQNYIHFYWKEETI